MLRLRNILLSKKPIAFLTSFVFCTYTTLCSFCLSYAMDENLRPYTSFETIQGKAGAGIKIGQIEAANTLSKKCLFNLSKELETELPLLAQGTSDKDEMREEMQIFEEEEAIRRERERKAQAGKTLITTGRTLKVVGILVGVGITAYGIAYASSKEDTDEYGNKEEADSIDKILCVVGGGLIGLLVGGGIHSLGKKMETKGKELVLSIDPLNSSVKLVYEYRF